MLVVALIWTYVLIITYLLGFGFLNFMSSWNCMKKTKSGSKIPKPYVAHFKESYVVGGVVLVTIYAEIISLFSKVGVAANVLLLAICGFIAVYYRNELADTLIDISRAMSVDRTALYYILIFLVMAYGTAHGIMHYDSDLYHAQAIHWIEDYRAIKGLGNLHVRLAYNSACFPLSALFSMSSITGRSFHVMAGFFALLLAWQCLDIKNVLRRGHIILSDFARIAAIYYLFTVYDEIVSPASDYFLSTLVFYIIIHWLDMNVRHEKSYVPYIQLALVGVFAITIKLSAAPVLLMCVIPIFKLLHNRTKEKVKAFWCSVLLALIIVFPFILRNIVISGWLIYPVTAIDIFNVSWKIPKGMAQYDALEIKTFGRGYSDVARYGNLPISEWFPHWFGQITGINKIMLILDAVAIIAYVAILLYFLVVLIGSRSQNADASKTKKIFEISRRSMLNSADFLTIAGTMIACLLFWFFSAPLVRYGVVYIWMTAAIVLGRVFLVIYNRIGRGLRTLVFRGFVVLLAAWVLYKSAMIVLEDSGHFDRSYLLTQQDYGEYPVSEFEIDGTTIYYPTEGDQVGYKPFPAATHDMTGEIEFYDGELENGIKAIDK